MTDRLLEPLLGGVYAGHPRAAVLRRRRARAVRAGADRGSLLRACPGRGPPAERRAGLRRAGRRAVDGWSTAWSRDLETAGVTMLRRARRSAPSTATAAGYRLTVGSGAGARGDRSPTRVAAGRAGRPSRPAAGGLVAGGRRVLRSVPYASVAVVTLVVRGLQTEGSGLLVPPGAAADDQGADLLLDQVGLGGGAGGDGLGRGRRRGPGQCRPDRRGRGAAARRLARCWTRTFAEARIDPGLGARRTDHRGGDPVGWCAAAVSGRAPRPGRPAARPTSPACPAWPSPGRRSTASASPPASARPYAAVDKITADLGGA